MQIGSILHTPEPDADREALPIDPRLFGDRPVSPSSQVQFEGTFLEFCRESGARSA
jgi:hypothetical protein